MNKILIALVLAVVLSGNAYANDYGNDLLKMDICKRIIVDMQNSLNASRKIEKRKEIKQYFLNNAKTLSEVYDNYCKD